jgi:putative endonuclease
MNATVQPSSPPRFRNRGSGATAPLPASPARPPRSPGRARRHHAGLAAEETAARLYEGRGAEIVARRLRSPEGEIDLVARENGALVFVEVKQRRRRAGPDSPITERQWRRLGNAALWYIMTASQGTGAAPACRFDAVIVGPDGTPEIIENARFFDHG